ncbi:MAG: hypothetical protein Q8Q30_02795 [Candidatus Woesebacteria bacterium]|nr:hypothetical protein [Candidatus Woesebacteria bacterium]
MIKYTTFTILFILFIVPALMASLIKMIPADDQPGYGDMGRVSVYGIRDFTQYFVSKNKNLVAIGTTIKNPNLKNKKDIIFNLYDNNDNLIRTTTLNGFNIGDGDFVKIIFNVIPDSKDKKYSFILESPDAKEDEIIEVFLTNETDYILNYSYDDETHLGGAPMVTFHKPDSRLETVKLVYLNLFFKLH